MAENVDSAASKRSSSRKPSRIFGRLRSKKNRSSGEPDSDNGSDISDTFQQHGSRIGNNVNTSHDGREVIPRSRAVQHLNEATAADSASDSGSVAVRKAQPSPISMNDTEQQFSELSVEPFLRSFRESRSHQSSITSLDPLQLSRSSMSSEYKFFKSPIDFTTPTFPATSQFSSNTGDIDNKMGTNDNDHDNDSSTQISADDDDSECFGSSSNSKKLLSSQFDLSEILSTNSTVRHSRSKIAPSPLLSSSPQMPQMSSPQLKTSRSQFFAAATSALFGGSSPASRSSQEELSPLSLASPLSKLKHRTMMVLDNTSSDSLLRISRSRANSLDNSRSIYSQLFVPKPAESRFRSATIGAGSPTNSGTGQNAPQFSSVSQPEKEVSKPVSSGSDKPPDANDDDTYVTYLTRLIESGFENEIVASLANKIPTKSMESAKDLAATSSASRTFKSSDPTEFYTNCLYLFICLYLMSMYYADTPLFPQSASDCESQLHGLLMKGLHDVKETEEKNFVKNLRRRRFVDYIERKVTNIPFDVTLRHFLFFNKLPDETQKIDMVLETLAFGFAYFNSFSHLKTLRDYYSHLNVDAVPIDFNRNSLTNSIFNSVNEIYTLYFALLVLHTDHFNKSNKNKMSLHDFTQILYSFPDTANNSKFFQLFTPDIVEYFYDNITSLAMKSITKFTEKESRTGSVSSLKPPLSRNSTISIAAPSSPLLKKKSEFPYDFVVREDFEFISVGSVYVSGGESMDLFDVKKEVLTSQVQNQLSEISSRVTTGVPRHLLKSDEDEDLSEPSLIPDTSAIICGADQGDKNDNYAEGDTGSESDNSAVFVRVLQIGVMYKQETKGSILPKMKKKKRRSRDFNDENLYENDDYVWKKYFAILTTFGIYLFKSINWDQLEKFEKELEEEEQKESPSMKTGKTVRIYPWSFFSEENNSELDSVISVDRLFAYESASDKPNSFCICYSNNDSVECIGDIVNAPYFLHTTHKLYNKGLFYCDNAEDSRKWIWSINYLAAMHKCLPRPSSLRIPGFPEARELRNSSKCTIEERMRSLWQEVGEIKTLIYKLEQLLKFISHLTPQSSKVKAKLRELCFKIQKFSLRSLTFDHWRLQTLAKVAENEFLKRKKLSQSVVAQARKLSAKNDEYVKDDKYNSFAQVMDQFVIAYDDFIISASESFLRPDFDFKPEYKPSTNPFNDSEMSMSPVLKMQFRSLI